MPPVAPNPTSRRRRGSPPPLLPPPAPHAATAAEVPAADNGAPIPPIALPLVNCVAHRHMAARGHEQRPARTHAAAACEVARAAGAADRRRIGDGEVVDRHVAGIDEEAALDAAAAEREIIAVDGHAAGRVERRQRVRGGIGQRDVVLQVDDVAGAGIGVDLHNRCREARPIRHVDDGLRLRRRSKRHRRSARDQRQAHAPRR